MITKQEYQTAKSIVEEYEDQECIKEFDVFLELYGKKMKVKILATTEEKAKERVKETIIFHKIKENNSDWNKMVGMMKEMKNDLTK